MTTWSTTPHVPYSQIAVTDSLILATGSTTPRLLGDMAADWTNVLAYGAVGDGVTSDQTAAAAAVAAAYASGQEVYWPDGTYLTTATIPNFHDVRHRGPGVVKRGSGLFYPDPSLNPGVTNILYVATTGSDTNDGLSSSEPRLTAQATGDLLYAYAYGDVTWKLQFAAGTYTETASFLNAFPTPQRVQFLGANVANGVQPTTLVEPASYGSASCYGFYFQNSVRAQVSDINFQHCRTGGAVSANALSAGIVVDARSEVYTENVWTDDCDQGIYVSNGSQLRCKAGRHGYNTVNGNGIQFVRHSHGTVGYAGTAADVTGATGTAFIGGAYGMMLQEYSMAHADYGYFSTQTSAGALLTNNSRVHSVSSTYLSCLVGIDARLLSCVGDTTNTFTTCTTNIICRSGSVRAGVTPSDALAFGPPLRWVDAVGGSTQSATPVSLYAKTFEANELQLRGNGFKLTLFGEVVGVADTKTVTVTLGATTLLTATIAASTTDYRIEVELMNTTAASAQKCLTVLTQNGVTPTVVFNNAVAEDLTASKTLTVTHQVTNVADLNRIGCVILDVVR